MKASKLLRTASRTVGRQGRRLRRRWWPAPIDVVYSEKYLLTQSAPPHDAQRADRILTFLLAEGLLLSEQLHRPHDSSIRNLRRVHTDAYLDSLREPEVLRRITGMVSGDADLESHLEIQRRMVGGTELATELALAGRRSVIHLGGGLHHAHADRGAGFCILNDIAVAIAGQRRRGFDGQILVVDLDLHHGDGTEAIFARDRSVHTFSIHNRSWHSLDAQGSTNVELGSDVGDDAYLRAIRKNLPPLLERLRPRLVFYLAGVDPAADDRIGDWKISAQGMLTRDLFVTRQVKRSHARPPMVITLGGGYGTKAWRYSARYFSALLNHGRAIEPPSTDLITLERYRQLSRLFDPSELTGLPASDEWELSADDVYGSLGPQRQTRFLGYYSKHGIEMVLERSGVMDRLRVMGFRHLELEWDLENESGQTIRLLASDHGRELLGELRAKRDRRMIPEMELLQVEWLLLQNPRIDFPDGRLPLPGQEYPGLGVMRDVVSLLLLTCDRLKLDGLAFVPAHYHLATTTRKVLQFLEPAHEQLYRALREALAGLTIAEASRAIEEGRVVDAESGETFRWRPMAMVLPVSERLKRALQEKTAGGSTGEAPSSAQPASSFKLLPT